MLPQETKLTVSLLLHFMLTDSQASSLSTREEGQEKEFRLKFSFTSPLHCNPTIHQLSTETSSLRLLLLLVCVHST